MKKALLLFACTAFVLALPQVSSAVRINEIRIDDSSSDNDEYFELAGSPGESLDGLTYVVLGDGSGSIGGNVEMAYDLTGLSIQPDGVIAIHDTDSTEVGMAGVCGHPYDLINQDYSMENSDNVTHMLISGFTGAVGDDLDTNDDGILDSKPWSSIVDCIALIETVGSGDLVYCNTQVGPDGTFVPGHVYFCVGTGWVIGSFTNCNADETPGDPNNNCPVSVEENSWGKIKAEYR